MKNVVRNFMILCIFIILGSAAINNRIRTSSDIEIKDVYAYTLDENEEHMSLDSENIDSDIENTDEGLNEEEIIEEEEPEKVIGKENEEIDIEGDLSNPLVVGPLNASDNEVSEPIKIEIKTDAGYKTLGSTNITFEGTTASKWTVCKTQSGDYTSSLAITDIITSEGISVYLKAQATSDEMPKNDTSVSIRLSAVIQAV